MKKICCLLLLFMLCMSTTYAVRGKECIKYLCGKWGIPHTDDILFYDSVGELIQADYEPKYESASQIPVIRYKYKVVDESSCIDDNTGKGKIITDCGQNGFSSKDE